ncbi:hypothetical protein ABVK25_007161 [Lepraria finkii]|uniref:Uncharacterized protein n=1 Tax=Lepraria finkii TaxID=1340010 RepID=A0ABR4B3Z5_9LECA
MDSDGSWWQQQVKTADPSWPRLCVTPSCAKTLPLPDNGSLLRFKAVLVTTIATAFIPDHHPLPAFVSPRRLPTSEMIR